MKVLSVEFLRIEALALGGVLIALLAIPFFGVRFYFPDAGMVSFVWKHYIGALVPALIIAWLVVLLAKRPRTRFLDYVVFSCRQLAAFMLILFLHFNLKLWVSRRVEF